MKSYQKLLAAAALLLALTSPVFADSLSVVVGTPPPAPIVETIPVSPGPDYVWREGYWRWVDERHVWIPGHWARRPRPEAVWVTPHWDHRDNGYYFVEGQWK